MSGSGSGPTLNGYIAWLQTNGFTTNILPTDSPFITYSFNIAMQIVNQQLNQASSLIYTLAVYNLACSQLISWQQDNPDATPPPTNAPTYWFDLRKGWGINSFVPGIVSSSSDEGTSTSWEVQDQLKSLTIQNLQNMKDPYGRTYLGFAQTVGTLWGLS